MGRFVVVALLVVVAVPRAHAVPSFGRQTGLPCDGCHSGGFFPELNNFGRMFKMNGYIWSAHEGAVVRTDAALNAAA